MKMFKIFYYLCLLITLVLAVKAVDKREYYFNLLSDGGFTDSITKNNTIGAEDKKYHLFLSSNVDDVQPFNSSNTLNFKSSIIICDSKYMVGEITLCDPESIIDPEIGKIAIGKVSKYMPNEIGVTNFEHSRVFIVPEKLILSPTYLKQVIRTITDTGKYGNSIGNIEVGNDNDIEQLESKKIKSNIWLAGFTLFLLFIVCSLMIIKFFPTKLLLNKLWYFRSKTRKLYIICIHVFFYSYIAFYILKLFPVINQNIFFKQIFSFIKGIIVPIVNSPFPKGLLVLGPPGILIAIIVLFIMNHFVIEIYLMFSNIKNTQVSSKVESLRRPAILISIFIMLIVVRIGNTVDSINLLLVISVLLILLFYFDESGTKKYSLATKTAILLFLLIILFFPVKKQDPYETFKSYSIIPKDTNMIVLPYLVKNKPDKVYTNTFSFSGPDYSLYINDYLIYKPRVEKITYKDIDRIDFSDSYFMRVSNRDKFYNSILKNANLEKMFLSSVPTNVILIGAKGSNPVQELPIKIDISCGNSSQSHTISGLFIYENGDQKKKDLFYFKGCSNGGDSYQFNIPVFTTLGVGERAVLIIEKDPNETYAVQVDVSVDKKLNMKYLINIEKGNEFSYFEKDEKEIHVYIEGLEKEGGFLLEDGELITKSINYFNNNKLLGDKITIWTNTNKALLYGAK